MGMPVNLHILTGFNYSRFERTGLDTYRTAVNTKLTDTANSLFDLVFGGVLARFPKLKFVSVENEVAWLPFFVHEWNKYYKRFAPRCRFRSWKGFLESMLPSRSTPHFSAIPPADG
jgi:hypothetical protein